MNETDRRYDWLKFIRKWGMIDDNINMFFLLALWLLGFKVAFWILLVLFIFCALSRGISIIKLVKDLKLDR